VANQFVDEALRMDEHPGVVFGDGPDRTAGEHGSVGAADRRGGALLVELPRRDRRVDQEAEALEAEALAAWERQHELLAR
jgi:hypothetical protein